MNDRRKRDNRTHLDFMTLRIWWNDNHGKLTYDGEKKKQNDTKK